MRACYIGSDGSGFVDLGEMLPVAFPVAKAHHIKNMISFILTEIKKEAAEREAKVARVRAMHEDALNGNAGSSYDL